MNDSNTQEQQVPQGIFSKDKIIPENIINLICVPQGIYRLDDYTFFKVKDKSVVLRMELDSFQRFIKHYARPLNNFKRKKTYEIDNLQLGSAELTRFFSTEKIFFKGITSDIKILECDPAYHYYDRVRKYDCQKDAWVIVRDEINLGCHPNIFDDKGGVYVMPDGSCKIKEAKRIVLNPKTKKLGALLVKAIDLYLAEDFHNEKLKSLGPHFFFVISALDLTHLEKKERRQHIIYSLYSIGEWLNHDINVESEKKLLLFCDFERNRMMRAGTGKSTVAEILLQHKAYLRVDSQNIGTPHALSGHSLEQDVCYITELELSKIKNLKEAVTGTANVNKKFRHPYHHTFRFIATTNETYAPAENEIERRVSHIHFGSKWFKDPDLVSLTDVFGRNGDIGKKTQLIYKGYLPESEWHAQYADANLTFHLSLCSFWHYCSEKMININTAKRVLFDLKRNALQELFQEFSDTIEDSSKEFIRLITPGAPERTLQERMENEINFCHNAKGETYFNKTNFIEFLRKAAIEEKKGETFVNVSPLIKKYFYNILEYLREEGCIEYYFKESVQKINNMPRRAIIVKIKDDGKSK